MNRKPVVLAVVLGAIIPLDIVTKQWALAALSFGRSIYLFEGWLGDRLPLTLTFNRGAAFSINVGDASRWFFMIVSIVALLVLAWIYRTSREDDGMRLWAVALVAAGAIGNLIDRIRWDRGVVDFIGPVDLGFMRWPIFNVADSAVTVGAILLVISLYREERTLAKAAAAGKTPEEAAERPPTMEL